VPSNSPLPTQKLETKAFRTRSAASVREALLAGHEIALLDVREEAIHATGHPLFAANLALSRIELDAYTRIPRRNTPIVVLDDGEGLALRAAHLLDNIGYSDIQLLEGSLQGWRNAGFELFQDVNAPSKAFGELVESTRHTPSLSAQEVKNLIDTKADIVIVDVRRFDEFQTMSIPTAISVPGGEVALRIRDIAPNPRTRVIVNCAGRTRSIIGTQSLVNAGIPNPVSALRNGTIGWTLAHQHLHHGESTSYGTLSESSRLLASTSALRVAQQAGVKRINLHALQDWDTANERTVYRFDVRTPEEFAHGHIPGFLNAPGGQLVQETDFFAPVRGARVVLADDDGTRANMTASWLAQMGWEIYVVDELRALDFSDRGPRIAPRPPLPSIREDAVISASQLHDRFRTLDRERIAVLDFRPSAQYVKQHIPGAWYALRSQLGDALRTAETAETIVLSSVNDSAARYLWPAVSALTQKPVFILNGGSDRWVASGFAMESKNARFASDPIDRYRRPYEGTDVPKEAIQAYLDWEYGLVAQLQQDGTSRFRIL